MGAKKAHVKRLADWLEKMAVASLAVGFFEGITWTVALGSVCLVLSHAFTHLEAYYGGK
jgi:hypothetical protein